MIRYRQIPIVNDITEDQGAKMRIPISFTCEESLLADPEEKDIVFPDIEMPGMNGIYVGNKLKKANKNVLIFVVTSYSEYFR